MNFDVDTNNFGPRHGHKRHRKGQWESIFGPYMKRFMAGSCCPPGFGNYWQRTSDGDYIVTPSTNVDFIEDSNSYLVLIELPGVSKENIDLKVTADSLKVEATRKSIKDEQKTITFKKKVNFRREILTERISAKYQNGLLKIELPVAEKPSSNVEIN